MSVYKKLHQLQIIARSLAANAEGQTGTARYPYVSGSKLLSVIRPKMDELGLILLQEVIDIVNTPITYNTRQGSKTEMFTTAHIQFTWVDVEDESKIVNSFYANGMNAWEKGLGSALTYAERFYLMKTLHIATDQDDCDAIIRDADCNVQPQPAPQRQARMQPQQPAKTHQDTVKKFNRPAVKFTLEGMKSDEQIKAYAGRVADWLYSKALNKGGVVQADIDQLKQAYEWGEGAVEAVVNVVNARLKNGQ